jgi:signal peptidase I
MKTAPRAVSISAAAALLLAAVWLVWPIGLGGGTVYVTTHGISMEPRFHTGDLAILRSAHHYSVGDVVAYSSATLQTTVMHRIVALDGDRFVIQGDNNTWLDPDRPTQDRILGKLWMRVPQGGKALAALRSPWVLALIGMAGTGVLGAARKPLHRRRRRGQPRPARAFSLSTRAMARQVTLASAAVATLAAAGGGVLLAMPATQTDSSTVSVTQQGRYFYTGTAVPGTTYPTGRIVTGDPIYTKLTGDLTVSFRATLEAAGLTGLRGNLRLAVSIAAPDGWTADVGRGATVPVAGRTTTASVVVQSDAAAQLLARHYAEVGSGGTDATLTISPRLDASGTVSGHPFTASPLPGLAFSLTPTALKPTGNADTALSPTAATPVTVEQVSPRQFTLLGHSVPLELARIAAGAVLGLSLIVLAIAAWIGRPRTSGDPADDFLMKNAARILPITRFTPGNTVIDVSDAEALHKVAERLDTLVLHRAGPDDHLFAVQDVETTYRFVLPIAPGDRSARLRPVVPENSSARLRSVPLHDDTRRLRRVPSDAGTARLRRVLFDDDTAPLRRVRTNDESGETGL